MNKSSSTISLELNSKPQNVAMARGMLSAVLELLGFGPEQLDDVKMAVSEACNNVVLHAYGDRIGPLFVGLELTGGQLAVIVRDRGTGIEQREPAEGRLGVGVPMMRTLADDIEFLDVAGGGTEVRLKFGWEPRCRQHFDPHTGRRLTDMSRAKPAGDVVVSQCPVPLMAGVLGRLATIIAAAARFTLDRLGDVRLLTDAVAARVQSTSVDPVSFALVTGPRRLELALGPFQPGTGGRLIPERSSLTASSLPLLLADEWALEPLGGSELVRVVITDPGAPRPTSDRASSA